MQRSLLDILTCPLDGHAPLDLFVVGETNSPPTDGSGADEDIAGNIAEGKDIEEGFLVCRQCASVFPIVGGIPHLVRGGLRRADREDGFFDRHAAAIADAGKTLELGDRRLSPSRGDADDRDRAFIDEGDYWDRFLATYVDRGDRSILDVRCKGTHPPFLHVGVAETDDRDTRRDMGMWPSHLSRPIREWYRACRGGRALDVGCGGGQFGLEPAYEGLRVVGIDVALGSLEIAHRHAREVGQRVDHVYADPAQPPFCDGAFDLLMGKDSLHHMPDVEVRLRRLSRLLKDDGRVLFYEHVGESAPIARVRNAFMRRLIPIIQRGCGAGEVSTVFNHGSVHEDVSRDTTLPALTAVFDVERVIGEMFLYYELEDLIYFASGKNAPLSTFSFEAAYWFERLLLLFQKPDHVTVFGRKRA